MTLSEPAGSRIPLHSTLERKNEAGGANFPLVSDSDLFRGWRAVDVGSDRDALTAEVAPEASFVWVNSEAKLYRRLADLSWLEVPFGDGGSGWVYVADIVPQTTETISAKTYQDAGSTVLKTATSDKPTVRVVINASYPLVQVNGNAVELAQSPSGGFYTGNADITLGGTGAVVVTATTPDGGIGAAATATVTVAAAPQILTLSFTGPYPGAQTELKAGDTFQITGTTDKPIDAVEIQDSGACQLQLVTGLSGTAFTVTGTIADRGTAPQALAASVRARDAAGAFGDPVATNAGGGSVDGVDVVTCNNLHPTVDGLTAGTFAGHAFGITYPGGQLALKAAESATVAAALSDFDAVLYDDPTVSELAIVSPAVFQDPKSVSRVGGAFNIASDNFRITATRAANDATTTVSGVVAIADAAPAIAITLPAARLRSGGNDGTAPQDHAVTITSDQPLLNAPTLAADAGGQRGTFQGAGFAGGPSVWTRDLRVDEALPDEKGTFAFAGLVATGLAGRVQNVIGSGAAYTLGGFVPRNLTFGPFATTTPLGTEVADFAKLQAATFTATSNAAIKKPIGTAPPVTDGYTIDAVGVNPTSVIWLDSAAASSNSGGTAQITGIEETA